MVGSKKTEWSVASFDKLRTGRALARAASAGAYYAFKGGGMSNALGMNCDTHQTHSAHHTKNSARKSSMGLVGWVSLVGLANQWPSQHILLQIQLFHIFRKLLVLGGLWVIDLVHQLNQLPRIHALGVQANVA